MAANSCKFGKKYEDMCSGKKYSTDNNPLECSTLSKDSTGNSNGWNSTKFTDNLNSGSVSAPSGNGFCLRNPNITKYAEDILYHLALGNKSHDLVELFGDVKFICTGGTPHRMERFSYYILKEIGYKIPFGTTLQDISIRSHRYALFKVGPVISVSHGMGQPSISILLHELIKLMYHAGVNDPIILRLGTCGGLGLEPGTVVVTTEPLNGLLEPVYTMPILGRKVQRPAVLCKELADQILSLKEANDNFNIVAGKTICTDDFYEGQARLDGAFCDYTEKEKIEFLKKVGEMGVTNFEMESLAMAAITHHAGVKCGVICVTLLDRLKGDQVNQSKKVLEEWQNRPMVIAARYIKKYLQENKPAAGVNSAERQSTAKDCVRSKTKTSDNQTFSTESQTSSKNDEPISTNSSDSLSFASLSSSSAAAAAAAAAATTTEDTTSCFVASNTNYLKRVLDESNAIE